MYIFNSGEVSRLAECVISEINKKTAVLQKIPFVIAEVVSSSIQYKNGLREQYDNGMGLFSSIKVEQDSMELTIDVISTILTNARVTVTAKLVDDERLIVFRLLDVRVLVYEGEVDIVNEIWMDNAIDINKSDVIKLKPITRAMLSDSTIKVIPRDMAYDKLADSMELERVNKVANEYADGIIGGYNSSQIIIDELILEKEKLKTVIVLTGKRKIEL